MVRQIIGSCQYRIYFKTYDWPNSEKDQHRRFLYVLGGTRRTHERRSSRLASTSTSPRVELRGSTILRMVSKRGGGGLPEVMDKLGTVAKDWRSKRAEAFTRIYILAMAG